MEVYQVDIERINNLNFQNYDIEEQEPGLLRYKINKREIPEEYKAILRTKSDDMDSVLSQIDERYAQKKPQEDINVKEHSYCKDLRRFTPRKTGRRQLRYQSI